MTSDRYVEIAGGTRHVQGWRRPLAPPPKDLHFKAPANWDPPKSADLRGISGLDHVENQYRLGSCTWNASTTALEFAMRRAGIPGVQLSRLFGYAKGRLEEGTPLTEDSGTAVATAMKVLSFFGCPEESLWPYDEKRFSVDPPASLLPAAAKYRAGFYYACVDLFTIKASIAQGFPVVGGFAVPKSMSSQETTKTGKVEIPTPRTEFDGGHAVLFCGYDDDAGWLVFQNSWGVGFGDDGFGYLPYEYITNGFSDDWWTIRSSA